MLPVKVWLETGSRLRKDEVQATKESGRRKEKVGGLGNRGRRLKRKFRGMRRSGWAGTGHVKRNESRSRTWLGHDPRYSDHSLRCVSFLCREFKLDTNTLHLQPLKFAPHLPNHPRSCSFISRHFIPRRCFTHLNISTSIKGSWKILTKFYLIFRDVITYIIVDVFSDLKFNLFLRLIIYDWRF